MRKLLVIFIVFLSFNACNRNKTPDYVIPKEKLIDILVDIHIMDGLLTINDVRKTLLQKDSLNYYDALFYNYNYTRADFDTSIFYYSMNINEYDKIYEEVLNKLSEMEAELKEKISNKDSLNKK